LIEVFLILKGEAAQFFARQLTFCFEFRQVNSIDEIIELYKLDVDVTLLDECLKRTVEERLRALHDFGAALDELRAQILISSQVAADSPLLS